MSPTAVKVARRCQELSKLSPGELRKFFASFDVVLADCDGVLWVGNDEIEGSAKCIRTLREKLDKRIFYCTNNSTKSRQEYKEKCAQMGFGGELDDIVGTSYLVAEYLKAKDFKGTVYVVGSTGMTKELDLLGIKHIGMEDPKGICQADYFPPGTDPSTPVSGYPTMLSDMDGWEATMRDEVEAVAVGMDYNVSYRKLAKAATALSRPETLFLATNTDEQFPHRSGVVLPGTGSIVSAVATAACRTPVVMGKPSPEMFHAVRRMHPEIRPERTLMIGDRANTDILFGRRCGLQTLLVGTGTHSLLDARGWEASGREEDAHLVPDFYVERLGDLVDLWKRATSPEEKEGEGKDGDA